MNPLPHCVFFVLKQSVKKTLFTRGILFKICCKDKTCWLTRCKKYELV